MSNIFANPATNNRTAADQTRNYNAWVSVCAKLGQTGAANIRPSGVGASELKGQRNTVRRAINAIRETDGLANMDEETMFALDHATQLVARIENMLDLVEGAQGRTPQMQAMRNSQDFDRHYSQSASFGEQMGIADFLRGVAGMGTTQMIRDALSTGTDTDGGYTVPGVLMPGILQAMAPVSSLLRAGAGIVPIDQGAKSYTTAAVATIPTAAWREELGPLAVSQPAFRGVVAVPRSLAFMFKVSRELLADGKNLTEALNVAIGQAFAKELDRVGLRGSGTAPEPRGILNTAGIQTVTNGANGASQQSTRYQGLLSAYRSILQEDGPAPTAAIMSPRSLVGFGGLADTTNQPLRMPGLLEGFQLIGTSQIPDDLTVGTSSDCTEIYVGDFRHLYFMLRENVSIQLLKEVYAATGEIGFACHMRADVVIQYPAAFALVTGVRP